MSRMDSYDDEFFPGEEPDEIESDERMSDFDN